MTTREPLEPRTGEKIEYARIHLDELKREGSWDHGNHWVRAHEESVLAQVVGAKDAFLQEINVAYGSPLQMYQVTEDRLLDKLGSRKSSALDEIVRLRDPANGWSWLALTVEVRNHGMHRARPSVVYYEGGEHSGTVRYLNPRDGKELNQTIPEFLETAIKEMEQLVQRLRPTLPA